MAKKASVSTKTAAIEGTKRVCDRTAGKEKCDEVFNAYKYGHKDTDTYFKDMDSTIRRGKKKASKPKKKATKRKKE